MRNISAIALIAVMAVCGACKEKQKPNLGEKADKQSEEIIFYAACPIDYSNYPFITMSETLRKKPDYARYRMNWDFSVANYQSSAMSVYDRKKQTIRESVSFSDGSTGDVGSWHREYSKVSDGILHKCAKELGDKGSGPFSFEALVDYGCKVRNLRK